MAKMKIGHSRSGSTPKIHPPSKEVSVKTGDALEVTWIDKLKRKHETPGNFLCVRQTGRKEPSLILAQGATDGIIPDPCYCIPIECLRKCSAFASEKDREVDWKQVKAVFDDVWKRVPKAWKTARLNFQNMGYGQTKAEKIVTRYIVSNLDKPESLIIDYPKEPEWTKTTLVTYKEYFYPPESTQQRLRKIHMKIQKAELEMGKQAKTSFSKVIHLVTIFGLDYLEKIRGAELLEKIKKLPS